MHGHRLLFFLVLAFLALYTVRLVERSLGIHRAWASMFTILLFAAFFGSLFLNRSSSAGSQTLPARWLIEATYFLMGVWITYLLFSLVWDFLQASLFVSRSATGWPKPIDLGKGTIAALLCALSTGMALWGLKDARLDPAVREIPIRIPGLAPGLQGLKIAFVSDLHIGRTVRPDFAERVTRIVNALQPDLIAIGGDIADGPAAVEKIRVAPLAQLKAPLGTYFITGNHEYYAGVLGWLREVQTLGMTPLVNENRVLDVKGAKLLLGGVTDTSGGSFLPSHRSDPAKAAETDEKVQLKLLLAHRPASANAAAKAGFDVMLCGHTHGGQFFPWSALNPLFYNYAEGLHRQGKMWIYVSHGTGSWGPPNRFLVPTEITLIQF